MGRDYTNIKADVVSGFLYCVREALRSGVVLRPGKVVGDCHVPTASGLAMTGSEFVGFIGFIGFVGLLGFVGFIGFLEFVELLGFVGFVEIAASRLCPDLQ